jgi:hypothetical protein
MKHLFEVKEPLSGKVIASKELEFKSSKDITEMFIWVSNDSFHGKEVYMNGTKWRSSQTLFKGNQYE